QAIAIGLSKARRAGVKLAAPKKGRASAATRRRAARDYQKGQSGPRAHKTSRRRSRATTRALEREGHGAASQQSLSRQARRSSRRRSARSRSAAAKKAARTRARSRAR